MARMKNALRGHYIAPYVEGEEAPALEAMEQLAKYVTTIDPDTDEQTEDQGFYDGDGTPETDVMSVAVGYSFTGFYDPDDAAQAMIAELEFETGAKRKVWHRRISADGSKNHVGRATVTGIVIGGGDATAYEAFECNIRWDKKPEVEPLEG